MEHKDDGVKGDIYIGKGQSEKVRKDLHMRNIKQTSLLPSPVMRVSYTEVAVLNRHLKATKRNHLGAMSEVELVEAGLAESTFGSEFCSSVGSLVPG